MTRAILRPDPAPDMIGHPSGGDRPAGVNLERDAGGPPLVFVVPMPPTLSNSGKGRSRHWRALEREKGDYWRWLDVVVSPAYARTLTQLGACKPTWRIPPAPAAPLAHATLTSSMVLGGAMDDDNAVARHKWLVDWLVRRGYLVSDRRTCVRWAAFPEQRVTRKEPARITLTLTPGVG